MHSFPFPSQRFAAVSPGGQVRGVGLAENRVLWAGHAASVLRAAISGTILVAM